MPLSRRRLLQLGALGAAIAFTAGITRRAFRRSSAPGDGRIALSAAGEEIVRALTPVVLGSLFDLDLSLRSRAMDDGISALDDYLAHLSPAVQEEVRGAFAALDLWPARLFLLGTIRPWKDAAPEALARFLRSAGGSRVQILRRIHGLLHSFVVLVWFDRPLAWPEIGYPGPPPPRGVELPENTK